MDLAGSRDRSRSQAPLPSNGSRRFITLSLGLVAEGEVCTPSPPQRAISNPRISILQGRPRLSGTPPPCRPVPNPTLMACVPSTISDTFGKTIVALRNSVLDQMIDNVIDGGLGHRDLKEYGEFAMDRTGFGPQSKSTNLNVNMEIAEKLSARRLKAAEFTEAVPAAQASKGRRPSTGSNDDQLEAVQLLPPSVQGVD